MTQKLRAALYARISTARQAEADLSLPDQIKQLQAYCTRRGCSAASAATPCIRNFLSGSCGKVDVQLVSITQELGEDAQGDLIRKILNAFDEHQSRENAKHTHRAMLGNARQGFWNGAAPPFGYATIVKERHRNKDKKVLMIKEDEARVVRQIVDLYLGVDGPPKGLKAIVSHLNERGITRRGRRFGVGSLQDLLTTSTYSGRHYFNQTASRTGTPRTW